MNITEKFLQGLKASDQRQTHRDDAQVGFGVRVEPKAIGGRISFFWNQKVCGKVLFRSLGEWPDVAVKSARDEAGILAGNAKKWRAGGCKSAENPFAKEKPASSAAPTFSQLVESYITNHLPHPLAEINHPEKAEADLRWMVKKYFSSLLDKPIDQITDKDVTAARDSAKPRLYQANRVIQAARSLFGWCLSDDDNRTFYPLAINPAAKVGNAIKETPRERVLSEDEQAILEDACQDAPSELADFIFIALYTGARKASILKAKWENVNLVTRRWSIPKEDDKGGKGYVVDLVGPAYDAFERRKESRTSSPFVFPPISGTILHLDKPFRRLMARLDKKLLDENRPEMAKFHQIHIHDLRRTCGTALCRAGVPLQEIAACLGHTDKSLSSTLIYSKIAQAQLPSAREAGLKKTQELMAAARLKMAGRKQVHPITAGGAR